MIDARRKAYLDAMGIGLWVRREAHPPGLPEVDAPAPAAPKAPAPLAAPRPAAVEPPSSPAPVSAPGLDWEALEIAVGGCSICPELAAQRSRTVFGVGARGAQWMLVGAAPGAEEDRLGEPFVGRAGKLLDNMLRALGLQRQGVYIANVLKCRPPRNRAPRPEEAAACRQYLDRQIELVQPRVILALGQIAAQNLLHTDASLARLRGTVHRPAPTGPPVVVTYHPADLLRSPEDKRKAWEDLLFARSVLAECAGEGGT